MSLDVPNLDRRLFDDLMAEARQRIARWAPEWTDQNASDPGIALVELYAWLTETVLFELNRVPDLTYVKFLELLGLRQRPASAAGVDLSFTAESTATAPPVVPRGARVRASGDDLPVVFETSTELAVVPHGLGDLRVDDGASFTPLPPAAAGGTGPVVTFRPFGWRPEPGNALLLGFTPPDAGEDGEVPPGRFPAEVRMLVAVPPAASGTAVVATRGSASPPPPPVRLVWEYLPATDRAWRPLQLFADGSVAFTRAGYVLVAGPREIRAVAGVADQAEPRYWLRCRLASGNYPAAGVPVLEALAPNTVPAEHLVTVRDELAGVTEGHPGEVFDLEHAPVVASTLRLEVRPEAGETADWRQEPDFLGAGPDDPVWTVDPDAGRITFGDGVRGRIPPGGAEVVALEYRYGGGPAGNVPADAVSELVTAVPGVAGVRNRRAAAGGSVRQPLDEVKRDAPAALRRQGRAVTAEDYASTAREVDGVADAAALPLAHPDHPGVEVPGAVTVVVAAIGDPEPSQELLEGVAKQLEKVRTVAAEVYVRAPELVDIAVATTLQVEAHAAPGAVVRAATEALKAFLAPVAWVPGGDGEDGGTWRAAFGDSLYPTELYRVLGTVKDVVGVPRLELSVGGRPHEDLSVPVELRPWALRRGGPAAITVRFPGDGW